MQSTNELNSNKLFQIIVHLDWIITKPFKWAKQAISLAYVFFAKHSSKYSKVEPDKGMNPTFYLNIFGVNPSCYIFAIKYLEKDTSSVFTRITGHVRDKEILGKGPNWTVQSPGWFFEKSGTGSRPELRASYQALEIHFTFLVPDGPKELILRWEVTWWK